MQKNTSITINVPQVVAEVIEEELVAINLETGCYYHANQTGGFIWKLLEQGSQEAEIITHFSNYFERDPKQSAQSVKHFLDILLQEKLVKKTSSKQKKLKINLELPHTSEKPFEEPKLQKHEDMKELLLLDPIHDVGDTSWPLTEVQ